MFFQTSITATLISFTRLIALQQDDGPSVMATMDGRTVDTNWYGTVRGTDFRYGFNLVRYMVRNLVPKSVPIWIKVRISYAKKLKMTILKMLKNLIKRPYIFQFFELFSVSRTKISTTYRPDKNPDRKSVPRTKIRTGPAVHDGNT